ncbi:MAG: hypothetical protein JXB45_07500, partial [Candidatus Krumholzibacteriota bacterium]|nr:hypothetical protein [Candidatus Krumholzibacteriota bacterium]
MSYKIKYGFWIIAIAALAGILSLPAAGAELIDGGTFESGAFTASWVHSGARGQQTNPAWADHAVVLDLPYAGNYSALLGFKYTTQRRNRYGFMYQDVTIPGNISRATLYFRYRQQGYDGADYDPFVATIRNTGNTTLATVADFSFSEWNNQFKDSGWIADDGVGPEGYDLSPWSGQTIRIHFRQENTADDLYETWAFVDNVSVVYKKFVDLAVDGQGNDLFGDLLSGNGGTSTQSGEAGETVSYLIDIENEGLDIDSYTISVSPSAGWAAVINYGGADYSFPWTTPSIPAGSVITATVRLTIPPGEPVGGSAAIVDAVSVSFGNRFDSVRLNTNVVPSDHLADLAIDSNGFGVIDAEGGGGVSFREVDPDVTVDYSVEILNSGLVADSFTIWFAPAPALGAVMLEGGTTHTGMFTTAAIDPGGTLDYTLRVTVPPAIGGGDYESFVYAKSVTDTLRKDGVRAVTRVDAPRLDMIICGNGDNIYDPTGAGLGGSSTIAGQRSITVYYPVVIQNEGGVVDSFSLDWTGPGNGWSAVINDGSSDHPFPWTTPSFEPFSQNNYILAVTIPGNAAYDTYISILDAASEVAGYISESVTAGITVASGNEVDLLIDGSGDDTYGPLGTGLGGSSIQTANPGDTVFFDITVQNENGENLFDLLWNHSPGWEVVIGDSTSTLRGVGAGVYRLEVRIPSACPGGVFDVIFDGIKTNKIFFLDSVRGRIIVNPLKRVDGLIDGHGDELFGAAGTGAGGLSLQGSIGGRTLNFTLELQNQGGDPESYTVDWSGFPGWTAVLEGQGAPYATLPIGAGDSGLFIFQVTIPFSAAEGDYDFIIDIQSTADPGNEESVTARVHVNPPPRTDLVIEGQGAFQTAPPGSGGGGWAMVCGDPGENITAVLEIFNRGGFADSFEISWQEPPGWPAGSVLLSAAGSDFTSPLVTGLIDPGDFLAFTVKISVPLNAPARSRLIIDGSALSRNLDDSVLLEVITSAFIGGRVFNDSDHDGAPGPGEEGWSGVTVTLTDPVTPLTAVTDARGWYLFEVPAGIAREVRETTPAGMVSLTPDTLSTGMVSAGDTVFIDFADVLRSSIAPEINGTGPAGGFIDLPHTVTAGTAGQASLLASLPAGWVEVYYRDVNGDGILDGGDRRLTAADLDLDPLVAGRDVVPVLVRVFVPPQVPAGTVGAVVLTLEQVLSGTAVIAASSVTDQLLILAQASGRLRLVKEVDLRQARPGEVVTYTIIFFNPGVEGVREIEIIDPVSPAVDLVTDAFGPGQD